MSLISCNFTLIFLHGGGWLGLWRSDVGFAVFCQYFFSKVCFFGCFSLSLSL